MNRFSNLPKVIWRHFFNLSSSLEYNLKMGKDWASIVEKFRIKKRDLDDSPILILFEEDSIIIRNKISIRNNMNYDFNLRYVNALIKPAGDFIQIKISTEKEMGNLSSWIIKIVSFIISFALLAHIVYVWKYSNSDDIIKQLIIITIANIICNVVNILPSIYTDPMRDYINQIILGSKSPAITI